MSRLAIRRATLTKSSDATRVDGSTFTVPGTPHNASTYLTTPTYDGSGQTTHPAIVDFLTEHGVASWNGHRYWMAITPYPSSNNDYENPSIYVSDDGLAWAEPAGITNPVTPLPTHDNSYNSDPDLVFNPSTGELHLYYRYYDSQSANEKLQMWVKTSADGITWSAGVQCVTAGNADWRLAPCLLREGDLWKMWVVERYWDPNRLMLYTSSDPLFFPGNKFTAQACVLVNMDPTKDVWHVDMFKHGVDYFMLMNCCEVGTDGMGGTLHVARSADGITWQVSTPVMSPRVGFWDSERVYRATGYIEGSVFRVWYSANGNPSGGNNQWHTGYTEIPVWW